MKQITKALVSLLAVIVIAVGVAWSQPVPQRHPAYLRALSDLRTARGYLERPGSHGTMRNEDRAISEIDAAIDEIKHASIDDGKDLHDHPPIDANLAWKDRFQKALDLLDHTYQDCAKEEDDPSARGLRGRILLHIDNARHFVRHAMRDAGH